MSHNAQIQAQKGSMLVISLFVIIIMAVLGLTIVRLLNASADSVVHEVYGLRAYNAAQSSMELMLSRAFPLEQNGPGTCNAVDVRNYRNAPGMEGCIAIARCSLTEGFVGESTRYYRFSSEGRCTAGAVITSRTIAVDAKLDN